MLGKGAATKYEVFNYFGSFVFGTEHPGYILRFPQNDILRWLAVHRLDNEGEKGLLSTFGYWWRPARIFCGQASLPCSDVFIA
jgi:hypothetical protein